MTKKPKETPKEELECPKKYVYDTGIIFECEDNIRVEIIGEDVVDLLNELHEENMGLRAKNTQLVIIMKDVVNDLKRMDTYRYAEHLEKIANIRFLSEEELQE